MESLCIGRLGPNLSNLHKHMTKQLILENMKTSNESILGLSFSEAVSGGLPIRLALRSKGSGSGC